jgi:hypothetical protein
MDLDAIRRQIDRILRSEIFADKDQLKTLLECLFQNMDSQLTLKPDRVIKELWPEDGATKDSADVATEIARLRKGLDRYYRHEGIGDPIRITLPNRSTPGPTGKRERRWIVAEANPDSCAPCDDLNPDPAPAPPSAPVVPEAPAKARRSMAFILLTLSCVVVIGAGIAIASRLFGADSQPQFGRLDGGALAIMNAEGGELWRKRFPDGFSRRFYEQGLEQRIWFGDLNGDGRAEVLFLYQPSGAPEEHSTTLICYSDHGQEKWRWTPGKDLPEVGGSPAYFVTERLGVLKPTANGQRRIVVSSHHHLFYPNQIALVDSQGKTVSEYWHSGMLEYMTVADLDGDGREEIVASGISNGYREATLIVIDADHLSGASIEAARPELQIHGMGLAHERLRLVFPRSDLNLELQPYNRGKEVILDRDRIRFDVVECQPPPVGGCAVSYEFDRRFKLHHAVADDTFRGAHKQFYLNRKDNHVFSEDEAAQFLKVRCLSGCRDDFVPVSEPSPER